MNKSHISHKSSVCRHVNLTFSGVSITLQGAKGVPVIAIKLFWLSFAKIVIPLAYNSNFSNVGSPLNTHYRVSTELSY